MNNGRILLVLLCGICFSFYSSAAGLENTSGEADYTLENIEHYSPFSDTNAAWYFKLKQLRPAGDEYVNLKFRLVDLRGQKEYYWNSVFELSLDSGHIYCFTYRDDAKGGKKLNFRIDTVAECLPDRQYAVFSSPGMTTFLCNPRSHVFPLGQEYKNEYQLLAKKKMEGRFKKELLLMKLEEPKPVSYSKTEEQSWKYVSGISVDDGRRQPKVAIPDFQLFVTIDVGKKTADFAPGTPEGRN